MIPETETFDASEFLTSPESQIELLADAFESGNTTFIAHTLCIVAKALGLKLTAVPTEGIAGLTDTSAPSPSPRPPA